MENNQSAMSPAPTLAHLRGRIAALERHAPPGGLRTRAEQRIREPATTGLRRALSFGVEAVDARFSLGGLAFGAHQATAAPGDRTAAALFALLLLARLLKTCPGRSALMVQEAETLQEEGALYGPGLHALGLDPGRLALVSARDGAEALRVVDEATRSGAVCAVVAELQRGARKVDLPFTQRLNVHGQQSSTLTLLLTPDLDGTSAAMSRWRVGSAPSQPPGRYLGAPTLDVELVRNRLGRPGRWTLEWSSEDEAFRLPAPLRAPVVFPPAHRPDAPLPALAGDSAPGAGGEAERRVAGHGGR
jgi:protein ImuA